MQCVSTGLPSESVLFNRALNEIIKDAQWLMVCEIVSQSSEIRKPSTCMC